MTTRGESRSRRYPTQEEAREPTQHRRKRGGGEQSTQGEQENEVKKQNPEERRIIRYKYRQFKQSMADAADEMARWESNRFHEVVGVLDELHNDVQKPREQIADAEAVLDITTSFLANVKGSMRKSGISPAGFMSAMLAKFSTHAALEDDDEGAVNIDWGRIGLAATGFLRTAPGVTTMLGPMDIEAKVRQAPIARTKRTRPTESTRPEEFGGSGGSSLWVLGPTSIPLSGHEEASEVREQGEEAAKAETDANMETMFGILRSVKRARLDALVLNRQSFSQTVENIFSLSFLVKDGRVAITYDKDGNHLVAPKNAPTSHDRSSGKVANTQFVFRYDWACWQLMQENLEAGTELMPDRQHTVEEPECQPQKQGTPIRKNSRNRGRETRKVACDEDEDDEAVDEDVPVRRPTKRNRTLIDQFR